MSELPVEHPWIVTTVTAIAKTDARVIWALPVAEIWTAWVSLHRPYGPLWHNGS